MSRYILLVCIVLMGCATTGKYEAVLDTWVGGHIDELVQKWGVPLGSHQMTDGTTIVEYSRSRNAQTGGETYNYPQTTFLQGGGQITTYRQQQNPTYNLHFWCKTRFFLDAKGTITKWEWEGNDCKTL